MKEPREIVLNDPNSVYPYIQELWKQIDNLQTMLQATREVRITEDYLKKVCELEEKNGQFEKMLVERYPDLKQSLDWANENVEQLKVAKEIIKKLLNYILTPEGFENGEVIKQAEQFLKE